MHGGFFYFFRYVDIKRINMKKLLLTAAISLTAISAFADLQGDGYYRVQNAITKRYAYLLDNRGSIDKGRGTADVKAMKLFMDAEAMKSDPATVFYIDCVSGEGTRSVTSNIKGQGTGLYDFFGEYVKIITGKQVDGEQSYYASASIGSFTKYLGDREHSLYEEEGYPDVDATGDWRLWYIHPMDAASDDCYFGVLPTLTAGGKYYKPFYASFPFTPKSDGMKVYAISEVSPYHGVVVIKEVEGVVPTGTPVIIECSSPLVSANRLDIGGTGQAVSGNRLRGVYFNNDFPLNHVNRTVNDKRTMRLLTVKDGALVFEQSDETYLPRNEAYLQLSGDSEYGVGSYRIVTEAEWDEKYAAVESISVDRTVDVYSLDGCLVKAGIQKSEVSSLGKGIYILRSGAAMEKLVVR